MMNSTIDNSLCAGRVVNFDVRGPGGIEQETGIFLSWIMCSDEDYGEIPYALIETAQGIVEMVPYISIQFPSPLLDKDLGDIEGKEEEP